MTLEELGLYAIPIFTMGKKTQSPYLVGSGTLYRCNGEVFLITARHVVDDLKDGLIITSGRDGFIRFSAPMAAFDYMKGKGPDNDVCVSLFSSEIIENLHPALKIVNENQISSVSAYDKLTLYAFVGYPHSKNKSKPKSLTNQVQMKPYYYVVRESIEFAQLITTDKNSRIHVAFSVPFSKANDINLQRNIQPPDPHGISGCGVWLIELNKASGRIERKELVAVGIEYLKSQAAFIATRIDVAVRAIQQLNEVLN
jgi:hypothetical protein